MSDRPTFADVFDRHARFVWRALRRQGVSEADIQDACQEVFLVIHRKLPEFEGRSTITSWIYSICIRVGSAFRRRSYKRHEIPAAIPPEQSVAPLQQIELETLDALQELDRALAQLSESQRQVFVLYEIEQLGMKEVAAVLGCPLQTAFSRLYAARQKVVEAIEEPMAEGDWHAAV